MMHASLAFDGRLQLGEGPVWDAARGRLLFVDIMRGLVHEFDPVTTRDRVIDVGEPVGAVAPTTRGDWLIATMRGFFRLDPESGRTTLVALVEADRDNTRMNDAYVDSQGRLWAGTMGMDKVPGRGSLYRLDPDGSVHTMLTGITTSNGIDWSPDDRLMYYVDTGNPRIDLFDFDAAAGQIANRRTFVEIPGEAGKPDGLVVDEQGGVWLAFWGGAAVHRYTPDGRLDQVVRVPVSLTTKPAFGGPELEDLYITSAWIALDTGQRAAEPTAGGVFHIRPGIRGRPAHRFAG